MEKEKTSQNHSEVVATPKPSGRGWGGARKGAGRKRIPHGKTYAFNPTLEVEAFLAAYGGPKAAFINEAVVFYAKSKGLL